MERPNQSVNVTVVLVGSQQAGVMAHRALTEGAAVSVRIGAALVYMHDAATVSTVARAWTRMGSDAQRLPREISSSMVAPVRGMKDPAVLIDAKDCPPMFARLERPIGQHPFLRMAIGRVMFDVRDLGAYATTVAAFRRAADLAPSTFLPLPTKDAQQRARREVARAAARQPFMVPRARRRHTGRSAAAMVPRARPDHGLGASR